MFLFLFIALSFSQNVTFETFDSEITLLTTEYPTILSCEPSADCTIFSNRILFLPQNWTRVKLQIILKDAEGFLLSNQSYLITKGFKEEEEKEEKEKLEAIALLPFLSIFICILTIFLIVRFNRKPSEEIYIYNKQKDRALASDFYQQ